MMPITNGGILGARGLLGPKHLAGSRPRGGAILADYSFVRFVLQQDKGVGEASDFPLTFWASFLTRFWRKKRSVTLAKGGF